MHLNVNEERGILWWADVYRPFSSLIASSNAEFKSKINWVCSSCCDFYSFLPPGFHTFLKFLPMRMGWVMSWNLPSQTDTVRLVFRVFQRLFLSDIVLLITQERSCFFLSHCCRQTDLLRSHILWSIMWVSLEVCLGPIKSSIDATVIRVLRF